MWPNWAVMYSYDEIVAMYPIRWSRDFWGQVTSSTMNKMYTALLSLFVGQTICERGERRQAHR